MPESKRDSFNMTENRDGKAAYHNLLEWRNKSKRTAITWRQVAGSNPASGIHNEKKRAPVVDLYQGSQDTAIW